MANVQDIYSQFGGLFNYKGQTPGPMSFNMPGYASVNGTSVQGDAPELSFNPTWDKSGIYNAPQANIPNTTGTAYNQWQQMMGGYNPQASALKAIEQFYGSTQGGNRGFSGTQRWGGQLAADAATKGYGDWAQMAANFAQGNAAADTSARTNLYNTQAQFPLQRMQQDYESARARGNASMDAWTTAQQLAAQAGQQNMQGAQSEANRQVQLYSSPVNEQLMKAAIGYWLNQIGAGASVVDAQGNRINTPSLGSLWFQNA